MWFTGAARSNTFAGRYKAVGIQLIFLSLPYDRFIMLHLRLLFIVILFPFYSTSQSNYVFQHLTIEDGLLANLRVTGLQDSQGYYWFSSTSGIQRFDGKNFITYLYPESGDKNSLAEWYGRPLEDKEANIWVMNESGVNIYHRMNRSMTRTSNSEVRDSNINNVCKLIKDRQNNILEITGRSVFRYNPSLNKAELRARILNDSHDNIFQVVQDSLRNKCWLLLAINGITKIAWFDYNNNKVGFLVHPDLDNFLHNTKDIAFFNVDLENNLWLADYTGNLFRFDLFKNEMKKYPAFIEKGAVYNSWSQYIIHDFLDDNNGTIWFGGENSGLLKYDIKTEAFTRIRSDNGNQFGLHYDQTIYSFFKDREQNIWIDTDQSMNIFNPRLQQFKYFTKSNSTPPDFNANVTSIFESSTKDIWISAGGNGVFKFDSNFIFRRNYIHQAGNPSSLGEPLNRTWCFGEDNNKRIWIGSQAAMLSILNVTTGKFTNRIIPEFNHSTIMHMAQDSLDNFWFGLYNGTLGKFNAHTSKFSVYTFPYSNKLRDATIIDGLMIKGNRVYASTSMNGLNRFDSDREIADEQIVSTQHIFTVNAMCDSILIGGTAGKGIFIHNENSKKTRFINTMNGLTSNIIYGTVPVKSNNVWIFANNGIDRMNISNEKIYHYSSNEGIKDHIILKAFCKLRSGIFLVASNSGIIYFNPDSILERTSPPDVLITDFHSEHQDYSVDSLLLYKSVRLPYSQNAITIEYASLSYSGRKTDQYFYQLKGINQNWVNAGVCRSVAYANLSPGEYIFQVKVQNADGMESLHSTTLSFTINPPWWRTVWAYLLWYLVIVSILYLFFDYRKRNRKIISDVRQGIASDLHDDIGSTLNSISVYSEIAVRDLERNPDNSRLLLEKMGNASRNMIDTMSDIVWAINPENDNFESTMLRMQYFAGELLSGKNIFLQFVAEENVRFIKLPIKKRKNLYLIFKEAINNAYKYSDCKTVNVNISAREGNITMIITDDGKGFELTGRSSGGNGLLNMHIRAKEIGAKVSIQSWPMKGTRIELQVPD